MTTSQSQERINQIKRDAHARAVEIGANPNHKTFQSIEDRAERNAQADARKQFERYQREHDVVKTGTAQWIKQALSNVATWFVGGLTIVGVIVMAVAVLIAETLIVFEGIAQGGHGLVMSVIFSTALTFGYLVMTILRQVIAHQEAVDEIRVRLSLVHLAKRIAYLLGLGFGRESDEWHEQAIGSERYVNVLKAFRWSIAAILIFGLWGRLSDVFSLYPDAVWYEFFWLVLSQSSIEVMSELVANTFYTLALLAMVEAAVSILHDLFVESTGGIQKAANFTGRALTYSDFYVAALEVQWNKEMMVLENRYQKKLAKETPAGQTTQLASG